MATSSDNSLAASSPLEEFVRDYVEGIGGVWEEIEPQVYDVLLPSANGAAAPEVSQIAFDPEALPEHPGAQLASFGTPLIDRLLNEAVQRGRFAQFYVVGLNLTPHDLLGRIRRAVSLPAGWGLRIERVRPMHFTQAIFWFQATFVSDQKEQEIVPVVLDLHYGRQVRHLEQLLDPARLTAQPAQPLPEARRLSEAAAYPLARERVVRTLAALANTRNRELQEQLERHITRMKQYYADLRSELEEPARRGRAEDAEKLAARREALEREERLRVAELRQKSTLRLQMRLLNLLLLQQPKLLIHSLAASEDQPPVKLEMVWDLLTEALEAIPCPECKRPTFAFAFTRQGGLTCPACATDKTARTPRSGREASR